MLIPVRQALMLALIAVSIVTHAPAEAQDQSNEVALATARELVVATRVFDDTEEIFEDTVEPLASLIKSMNPGKEAAVDQLMNELFLPLVRDRVPEILDVVAQVYVRHFTADELEQLLAFYRSPVGRKFAAEQQMIIAEVTELGSDWAYNVATEALTHLNPEFESRGISSPYQ